MTDQLGSETEVKDITITYDTLFEILRNEKTREDLQKLHITFFKDVVSYLNEKQKVVNEPKEQKSLFENDEREKTIHQITNIKKILRDIYEKREKKIINMALNKSRFSSNILDTSSLLEEEKLFYEMIVSLLDSQRERLLNRLLSGQHPEINKIEVKIDEKAEQKAELVNQNGFESADKIAKQPKLVRFLMAVPQFMGEDMLEYGPFEEEELAKLPADIANVLIEKERAEEIKEN